MDKLEALAALEDADHAIFYVKDAERIAEAFGVKPPVRTFSVGQGRVATFRGGSGEGVDAAELACAIADSMHLSYPPMMGVGSRLRVACGAIRQAVASSRDSPAPPGAGERRASTPGQESGGRTGRGR